MGKKTKIGKRRRDKFYHLAKETGYRARSAFKLIQLNRKFNFLQQSRVLVDLCAAPGGWLQVASNHMPVSSVIVGVDLVKIKPIHNVITIQSDITTPQCRQLLQKELKTWKADCILNDGSPNVGSAWLQDAFTQAELTLSALKLATEFLRQGGTFVTKVFRSRDYQSLMLTFQQLFNKVHATKPQASRNESAEIFVVCQGYKPTRKPDPKLLDPKYVFQEQTSTDKQPMSLQKLQKPSKAAEGYDDNVNTLFQSSSVLDFLTCDDHMTVLGNTHRLIFDKSSEVFSRHPETSKEIIEYCEDIKVLGLRELKLLIKWREKMRSFLDSVKEDNDQEPQEEDGGQERRGEDMDLDEVDRKVKDIMKEEQAELKSALKRKKKMLKKVIERSQSQKETHREVEELIADKAKTFSLKTITSGKQLKQLEEGVAYSDSEPEDDAPPLLIDPLEREGSDDESMEGEGQGEEPLEWESSDEEDSSNDEDTNMNADNDDDNPLVQDSSKLAASGGRSRVESWFGNPVFQDLIGEEEEDIELETAMMAQKSNKIKKLESKKNFEVDDKPLNTKQADSGEGLDQEEHPLPPAKIRKLDPEGLAIGTMMVASKKKRMELINSGYNRWSNNDDSSILPDWFIEDEGKHCRKQIPVSKDMVDEYRKKLREINARPIKKIAEAKARKKQRAVKKLEGIRKRAQVICDTSDVTDHEKAHQIRNMYKKAGFLGQKKEEVKYVVAKKGVGKRVSRPKGVTGRFKVVDPRMKKDKRSQKQNKKKGKR